MEFVDQPPHPERIQRYEWPEIVSELRANPGKWARLETKNGLPVGKGTATSVANQIRHGKNSHTPLGEFEAVSRSTDVYMRYVGK